MNNYDLPALRKSESFDLRSCTIDALDYDTALKHACNIALQELGCTGY